MHQCTAIIVLNYNNWEDTINCIDSVEIYNTAEVKYIIIDNGSTRKSSIRSLDENLHERFSDKYKRFYYENDAIPELLPYCSFVVSQTNDGYARGNNKGLEYAYADSTIENVMILNNDILFIEDIIPSLLDFVDKQKDVGIVSPILYKKDLVGIDYNCAKNNPCNWDIILTYLFLYRNFFGFLKRKNNRMFILKANPEYQEKKYFEIELPSGSCMLIKKNIMLEIGGFDPNTFLYYEEPILYKKIRKLGLKNYLFPQCRCIHLGAGSTSKTSNLFVTKHVFNSIDYYFKQYCPLNYTQKIVFGIAKQLFLLKIKFKDWLN